MVFASFFAIYLELGFSRINREINLQKLKELSIHSVIFDKPFFLINKIFSLKIS